jgi:hypothetical protein
VCCSTSQLLPPFHNISHFSIFHIHIDARMTYIVKRRKYLSMYPCCSSFSSTTVTRSRLDHQKEGRTQVHYAFFFKLKRSLYSTNRLWCLHSFVKEIPVDQSKRQNVRLHGESITMLVCLTCLVTFCTRKLVQWNYTEEEHCIQFD